MSGLPLKYIGRFNYFGLAKFSSLLRLPMQEVLEGISSLTSNSEYFELIPCEMEIRPVENRLELAEILHKSITSNIKLKKLQSDQGLWSWLAAAWMPALFENSPRSAKIGEQARWILDLQKTRYYRHLLAGPYFIYNHHLPNPKKALSILGGSAIVPGELVGQIAASSDIAFSVGAEVATILYVDPKTGKAKKGSGGAGPGSPRRLTAAYLNQIDLTVDYLGMSAEQVLRILPKEFDKFKTE
jgi:hypothetical protein